MDDLVIGLDVGTTLVKSILFDTAGHEVAIAEHALTLKREKPAFAEQDGEALWQAVLDTLQRAASSAAGRGHIHAVALATQGGSVIPLDEHGAPLNPLVTWMDTRAESIVRQWQQGEEAALIRRISGWNPAAGLSLPIIVWLQCNRPDICQKTAHWLTLNDFLSHRLTGEFVTNPSMAGEMLLMDLQQEEWSEELCQLAGIHRQQLATILPSNAFCGGLTPPVAASTGIPAGTPLVNGGQDHSCEALALGITSSETAFLGCGTAWVINAVTHSKKMDDIPAALCLNPHVLPGLSIASQLLGPLGSGPEWCARQFWGSANEQNTRKQAYAEMDRALLEHLPQRDDPLFLLQADSAEACETGASGGYSGLALHHGRAAMSRAVLESAVFETRIVIEELRAWLPGLNSLWMIGGAARSPIWPQMLADACHLEIDLPACSHGPGLGAAMLALVEIGLIPDYDTCRRRFAIAGKHLKPDPQMHDFYLQRFERYLKMKSVYAAIARDSQPSGYTALRERL